MELNLAKNHKAEHTHLNVTSRRFLEISTSIDKADLRNLGSGLPSNLLDWKFVVLSHNTIRGAAGAAVLNAEVLALLGKLDKLGTFARVVSAGAGVVTV